MMKDLLKILFLGALALSAPAAFADPIGPTCNGAGQNNSCFGNIFTLEYAFITDTHATVTLTIDTTNHSLPATSYIQAVAIKPASSILNTSTLSSDTAPGNFVGQLGGLANGCNGSGSGFICAQSSDNLAFLDGSTYTWVFDIFVANSNQWLLGSMDASVKANYNPGNGLQTSEPITLQNGGGPPLEAPEPQTLALIGLGLLGMALVRRKRNG